MSEAMEELKEVKEEVKHTDVPANEGPLKKWLRRIGTFIAGGVAGGGLVYLFTRNDSQDENSNSDSESPAE